MEIRCHESIRYLAEDHLIERNQRKTRLVVFLTTATMIGEVIAGYFTGSMALTAEGWHMASHAGALLIALFAYKLAKSQKMSHKFSFGAGKLIPLGGYTSAIVLAVVALLITIESISRFFNPIQIEFNVAIGIACLGLCVNIASALILNHEDHEHDHHHVEGHKHVHDHNIRSAFLHVLADAVTSLLAIGALTFGKFFHVVWLDSIIGIVGAAVIVSWAFQLCKDTGWELLDGHSKTVDWKKLKSIVEVDGAKILDFHVWRIAPKAIACELVVGANQPKGTEHYRTILREDFRVQHIIVEERLN
jgi:cation diffusion facilitator family transporter